VSLSNTAPHGKGNNFILCGSISFPYISASALYKQNFQTKLLHKEEITWSQQTSFVSKG